MEDHSPMLRQTYTVEGLDCAEEVAALRGQLAGREGIGALDFDVLRARMTVEYDPASIAADQIIAAVAATGMRAVPWERHAPQAGADAARRGRVLAASASGALLAGGFIAQLLTKGSALAALAASSSGLAILFYAASTLAGGWFVLPRALQAARALRPDMHLLMTIAVSGAIALGEWFEAATVAFLFAVALLLEQWSVARARRAIGALLDLSPRLATRLDAEGRAEEVPLEQVPVDATILVRPGERLALDGVVVAGETSMNQAPITGESMPVPKGPDDEVFAGAVNVEGAIHVRTTRAAGDTTLDQIVRLVEQAQARRARAQQWVDRFALYYTPIMLALAVGIAVVPPLLVDGRWADWFYQALVILVIACPCALVISTPVSIVSALTSAARHGVLVKGGVHLEMAGRLRALAIDKTGTLTRGSPEVQQVVPTARLSERELLTLAAGLESHSEHPIARAILRKAGELGIEPPRVENFRTVSGRGAKALIGGHKYWIGSLRMLAEESPAGTDALARAAALQDAGHSVVAIGDADGPCGLISVADSLREGAREAVLAVKRAGVAHVVMLTGDNEETAQAIAKASAVDDYRAGLLPDGKAQAVADLLARYGHVGMIGDGINDAPALSTASLGIAMGAMGTDAAIEAADIALMTDDLDRVPWVIRHARRTLRVIQQNIIFSLALKLLFVVLALAGVATLWMAIAADMGASLLVILNALRLLGTRGEALNTPPRHELTTTPEPDALHHLGPRQS